MKLRRATPLVVLLLTGLLSTSTTALAAQATDPRPARLQEAVDRAAARGFSGQALVLERAGLFVERSVGLADREGEVAVTPDTLFDIGSVAMELTRALVLELAAAGKLALDEPLSAVLGKVPDDKAAITIEQLLSHRSGLGEYHDTEGDFEAIERDEAVRSILAQELRFAPGSDEGFSNSGYTLLAAIVEARSGTDFERAMRHRILEPAGLERTGFHGDPRWQKGEAARGYGVRSHGDDSPRTWPQPSWAILGFGGMVSNARELSRWQLSVRNDEALSEATRRILAPALAPDERLRVIGGVNDFGFAAYLLRAPGGRDVIVLSNSGMELAERLTMELGAILTGRRME